LRRGRSGRDYTLPECDATQSPLGEQARLGGGGAMVERRDSCPTPTSICGLYRPSACELESSSFGTA